MTIQHRMIKLTTIIISSLLFHGIAQATDSNRITAIRSNSHAFIKILPAPAKQSDSFFVTPQAQPYFTAFVKNHTLVILDKSRSEGQHQRGDVTVYLHELRQLDAFHATSVMGTHLQSHQLAINTNNRGRIDLNGLLAVSRINARGPCVVNIRWIKSRNLEITASDDSQVVLAGIVYYLRARASGHSTIDAQFLRTNDALAQTSNYSTAKVNPLDTLRAFAFDNSTVYFYKQPKTITRFTNHSGNILQVGWRK